uniref:Uncharacterized protein n=1 Tax=Arundo donax TaxID=35708 RepID=A0A0A8ZZA8_ARUDO
MLHMYTSLYTSLFSQTELHISIRNCS